MTKKTQMQYDKILAFMEEGKEYGIWDFCELLGLKESRTKDILNAERAIPNFKCVEHQVWVRGMLVSDGDKKAPSDKLRSNLRS